MQAIVEGRASSKKAEESIEADLDDMDFSDKDLNAMFRPPTSYCDTHKKALCPCKGKAAGRKTVLIKSGWEHFDSDAVSNGECRDEMIPQVSKEHITFMYTMRTEPKSVDELPPPEDDEHTEPGEEASDGE